MGQAFRHLAKQIRSRISGTGKFVVICKDDRISGIYEYDAYRKLEELPRKVRAREPRRRAAVDPLGVSGGKGRVVSPLGRSHIYELGREE